jgi:hypothetical protein
MLSLKKAERPLAETLALDLDASQLLEMGLSLPTLLACQEHPDIALIASTGIFLPPHERIMLYTAHSGTQTNVYVCSRGTSKSTTLDVLYPGYLGLFYAKRKMILLSATGFRGGQLLFNDMDKWVNGGWDSQQSDLHFMLQSCRNPKFITRLANYWMIKWDSMSEYSTYPTNDEDKLRGLRGHDLMLDEINTMSETLVTNVAEPFLNVTGGFDSGGLDAAQNRVFMTTTIDYSWRSFHLTAVAARNSLERDMLARKALIRGDRDSYKQMAKDGLSNTSYVSFDYSDTIIRDTIETRDGRSFKVNYPRHEYNKRLQFIEFEGGVPFITRDANGIIQQESPPVMALKTYPLAIDKLEEKLRDGTGSVSSWLSEQKNVTDSAVGDVYPHHVVDNAACVGDRCVIPYDECPADWQQRYKGDERGYAPSVMWDCSDPCVLGVDYAGGQRDFSALVVIRLGPLAKGEFNPLTGLGKTEWSNVIWCEMHRLTSHDDVAEKIREYRERYNLVYVYDEYEEDTWKACRAIGLDMKGGGTGVRDALVYINEQELQPNQVRIYDPLDKDERVLAFAKDRTRAIPMLDTIQPSDQLNDKLVEFTLGQMQQKLLYVPKAYNDGNVGVDKKLRAGTTGAQTLAHQLRKLQRQPTKNYHNYFMQGDLTLVENKKDMWSAFIYAAKQARAHIIRHRNIETTPVMAVAVRTTVNAKRGQHGRASGAKY